MITGHCECGAVAFEVDGEIFDFSHCHCSQCRRLHGAAYATFAGVQVNQFSYVNGADKVSTYHSSSKNVRAFCEVCGSNISVASATEPEALYVSMSAIDGNPPLPTGYHIYVGSKAPWHKIVDDLEQFDGDAPE